MYTFTGAARNVGELISILAKLNISATLTLKCTDDNWSYIEVWVSEAGDDVMLK
jgi:hypothetical protein